MIYDSIGNFKIYPYGPAWMKAFNFIKSSDEDSEEKKYDLGDGIYAVVESYSTKNLESAVFESHQRYVDIQWTISGAEGIYIASSESLEINQEYHFSRDVTFYKTPQNFNNFIRNYPGYFSTFWPNDAHMPKIQIDSFLRVKKGVVKIPIHLLRAE